MSSPVRRLPLQAAPMVLESAAGVPHPYPDERTAPSANPIRVTHVMHDFDAGGLESLVSRLAEGLAMRGVRTSAVSLSGRLGRAGMHARSHFETVVAVRPARGVSMVFPAALMATIRRTRADVVHLHSGVWFKGAWAARLAGVSRVVFTEHGREHNDPPLARWLDRQAARLTDVVIPVSGRLEQYLNQCVGVPREQLRLIENGIDTERFTPGARPVDLARRLRIRRDQLVVGSVGRLVAVKGYDRLLTAFAQATARTPDAAVLVIFGDGEVLPELRERAVSLGISSQVRFPGWVPAGPDVYRLFDVFALSSRSEGLSLSLLEAMACGVVPVVTDVGTNAEVLGGALAGQVVGVDDMDALTRVLRRTLAEHRLREPLREIARRRVAERYAFDRVLDAYRGIYAGVAPAGAT